MGRLHRIKEDQSTLTPLICSTTYPNGSNYQRLNANGHGNNPTPHGHGHGPGTGPGMKGQGPALDIDGNVVPNNTDAAHWPAR